MQNQKQTGARSRAYQNTPRGGYSHKLPPNGQRKGITYGEDYEAPNYYDTSEFDEYIEKVFDAITKRWQTLREIKAKVGDDRHLLAAFKVLKADGRIESRPRGIWVTEYRKI